MAEVGFSGDGFLRLAERLREFTVRFAAVAEEGAVAIAAEMHSEVNTLYGQKLGQYWTIEHGANSDAVMAVTVWTDDVKVRGYEFGTPRHRIPQAGYARPVLFFEWKEGKGYFPYVEHPGTRPHDKRFELQAKLKQSASGAWSQALQNALGNL
ncbi:MAG: hypothetical protein ACXWQ5_00220 [Ktedonobacterales bacterium]